MQASGETAAHQTATRKLPAPRGNNEASDVDRLEQTYRRITRRVHPDWSGRFPGGGSRVAHNGVMTISDAYDCLSDLALRCPIVGRVTDPDALLGNPGARLASADECMFCGHAPVAPASFRYQHGLLETGPTRLISGPMCRGCGLALSQSLRRLVRRSGWWGLSQILSNLGAMTGNRKARRALRRLGDPRAPSEPRLTLLREPMEADRDRDRSRRDAGPAPRANGSRRTG